MTISESCRFPSCGFIYVREFGGEVKRGSEILRYLMMNKNECAYMQKMECGIYQKRRRREKWDEAWNVLRGYGHISRASYRFYDSGSFL